MTTFVLVHGSWHGAWCWDETAGLLTDEGHGVAAPDLPMDRPDAGWEDLAGPVARCVREAGDDCVLLGHSKGAAVAALAAAAERPSLLIYLCPATLFASRPEGEPEAFREEIPEGLHEEAGADWWDPAQAIAGIYAAVPHERAERAAQLLRRDADPGEFPLGSAPDVPSAFVYAADDQILTPEGSRWAARNLIGVEPDELEGGHWPMLERPDALGRLLVRLSAGASARP